MWNFKEHGRGFATIQPKLKHAKCDIVKFLCRSDQIKLTLFGGNRNTRKGSLSVKNVPIDLINITLLNRQEEEEEEKSSTEYTANCGYSEI